MIDIYDIDRKVSLFQHCVSWALWVCKQESLHELSIELGQLNYSSGMMLIQFTKQDFCNMVGDDSIGKIFYKSLKELIITANDHLASQEPKDP